MKKQLKKNKLFCTLTNQQSKFIENGITIDINGDVYYNIPFWFRKTGKNKYQVYDENNIPDDLKKIIDTRRRNIIKEDKNN